MTYGHGVTRYILQVNGGAPFDATVEEYAAAAGCDIFELPTGFRNGSFSGHKETFTLTSNAELKVRYTGRQAITVKLGE